MPFEVSKRLEDYVYPKPKKFTSNTVEHSPKVLLWGAESTFKFQDKFGRVHRLETPKLKNVELSFKNKDGKKINVNAQEYMDKRYDNGHKFDNLKDVKIKFLKNVTSEETSWEDPDIK